MSSQLLHYRPHEAPNPFEQTLFQSFTLLQPTLTPPFPLTIPTPSQYTTLNQALLYALLTQPHSTNLHFTHLHAIVTDGYQLFTNLLTNLLFQSYPSLLPSIKLQSLHITRTLIKVSAIGIDSLLICLMRSIITADLTDENLWLCVEVLQIITENQDFLLEEKPDVVISATFNYLRLLSDHCTLKGEKYEFLKNLEIGFCVNVLRNHFQFCLRIGRDLIRVLQDLVYVPEFKDIWKDLLLNPIVFKVDGFCNISQIYSVRTSSRYVLLRITPEMENQLRFLLTHVKWGFQRRYQAWFAAKWLCRAECESVVVDIVRFICCAHHPSNEIIQSNVVQRWAVIGWLLKCCRSSHVEAKAKLALLYDWMFFNERVDNIMNIEPGMLLMVHSIPQYTNITHMLLEFLFHLVDHYDVQRKDLIVRGVSTAFSVLVRKGVVHSLEVFSSCPLLSPILKAKLVKLSSSLAPPVHQPHCSMPQPSLPGQSDTEMRTSHV